MNQTGIEWCDRTWNPMTGCLHGCSYCYARQVAETRTKAFPKGFEPVFHDKRLALPAKVKDPQVVFVGSMTDMMGEWWYKNEIEAVIDVCDASPHHTFLWLTKNPGRYASFIWPSNCWLGTTITNQADADKRAISLVQTRGVKRFFSIEPMHGGMILQGQGEYKNLDELRDRRYLHGRPGDSPEYAGKRIHQVILGGETGREARPMHPDWVRSVRDQCEAADVPFFFKSWGEWAPASQVAAPKNITHAMTAEGVVAEFNREAMVAADRETTRWEGLRRVGKKAAGRLLDGREHNDLAWRTS